MTKQGTGLEEVVFDGMTAGRGPFGMTKGKKEERGKSKDARCQISEVRSVMALPISSEEGESLTLYLTAECYCVSCSRRLLLQGSE